MSLVCSAETSQARNVTLKKIFIRMSCLERRCKKSLPSDPQWPKPQYIFGGSPLMSSDYIA